MGTTYKTLILSPPFAERARAACIFLLTLLAGCSISVPPCTSGCAVQAASAIPEFPWPAPAPTTSFTLPPGVATTAGSDDLSSAYSRLVRTLVQAGIYDFSVYAIGSTDSGFAIVSRVEQIDSLGQPHPNRFPQALYQSQYRGLGDWIRQVFRAEPGYYRFLALLVTSRPVVANGAPLTPADAERLLRDGALHYGGFSSSPRTDLTATALIYEFERRNNVDPVTQRRTALVSPPRHLAAAGLWPIAFLTP